MSTAGTVGQALTAPHPDAPGRPAGVSADDRLVGRTTVSAKAFTRIIAVVAGNALGVRARQIRSDIADDAGRLSLVVRSPIRVAPLRIRTGEIRPPAPSLLDRVSEAQRIIRSEVESLTGSTISRVEVRLTGVEIEEEGRVA